MYLLNHMPSYFSLKTLRIVALFLYMMQQVYLSWSTRFYEFLRITENVLQKKKLTYLKRSASQIQNIYRRTRVVWTWIPSLLYTKYCTSITFKNFLNSSDGIRLDRY